MFSTELEAASKLGLGEVVSGCWSSFLEGNAG